MSPIEIVVLILMKFDLTAIELDKDYYEQAKQRLINHQRQLTLF
jgi:hypothetical protein